MSVLIKGLTMPEKCGSCDLFHVESPMHCTVVKGRKTVGAPYGMPRPEWCPLVEIPEHGRLIDADAIPEEFLGYEFDGKWSGCTIKDLIDEQTTVIEGSENHDD